MGLGHASRCLAVAQCLIQQRNVKLVFSSYGDAVKIIKNKGFKVYETLPMVWSENEKGEVDAKTTLKQGPLYFKTLFNHLQNEALLIRKETPDVIVSDSRISTILAATLLQKPIVTIVHQIKLLLPPLFTVKNKNDKFLHTRIEKAVSHILNIFWSKGEKILVPDFKPPYTLAKSHLNVLEKYKKRLSFIGPILLRKPEEYPPQEEIKKKLKLPGKNLIYISISGTPRERKSLFERVKPLIKYFKSFNKRFHFIVTKGDPSSNYSWRSERLSIHSWVADRFPYVKACDVLVTRGGHNTVSEAIYYGKPMLIIPTPNHPEHQEIASNAEKLGIARVVQQNEDDRTLINALITLVSSDEYKKRAKYVASEVKRYDAVKEATKLITGILDREVRVFPVRIFN